MINWLKRNWALLILIVISVIYLKNSFAPAISESYVGGAKSLANISEFYPGRQVAPTDTSERLVIQDSSLSLQVKDVAEIIKGIEETTKSLGGFLVNSNLSKPQGAASGTISVRVPEGKRAEAMAVFKRWR